MKDANGAVGAKATQGSDRSGEASSRKNVLSFLDRSMGGLASRLDSISSDKAAPQTVPELPPEPEQGPPEPVPEPETTQTPSTKGVAPAEYDDELEGAGILPDGATGWPTEVELLYNDLLRLFALGDTDGALVSLERLLVIAPADEQIASFLEVNEPKLSKLYEGVMGPWSNVPSRVDALDAPRFYGQHQKFKAVLHLIDGKRDIEAILEESYFQKIETCALLDQLIRAKLILPHDPL